MTSPCEESLDYNFQNCIFTEMISNVGCKPYWMDHIQTDKENCSEASQLDKFLEYLGDLTKMSTEEELTEKYNCLKPCIYMEYKVDIKEIILIPKLNVCLSSSFKIVTNCF